LRKFKGFLVAIFHNLGTFFRKSKDDQIIVFLQFILRLRFVTVTILDRYTLPLFDCQCPLHETAGKGERSKTVTVTLHKTRDKSHVTHFVIKKVSYKYLRGSNWTRAKPSGKTSRKFCL
jgi:hypothetical protein